MKNRINNSLIFHNIVRFSHFLKPHWKIGCSAGICMFISVLFQLPMPLLTMYIIDVILVQENITYLNLIMLGLFLALVSKLGIDFFQKYLLTIFNERVIFNVKMALFKHVQNLPLSYYDGQKTGYLMARVTDDATNLQGLLANTVLMFLRNVITFFVGVTFIFFLHWKLAIVSIIILPFFIFSFRFFSKKIRNTSREIQEKSALVTSLLQESIAGIFVVKSNQMEKNREQKMDSMLKNMIRSSIKNSVFSTLSSLTIAFIGSICPLIVLWYGTHEIINGNLTVGKLMAFNSFLYYIFGPVQSLLDVNITVQRSLASLERIYDVLNLSSEFKDKEKSSRNFPEIIGKVTFNNVSFSYNGNLTVFQNVNFIVEPGMVVAIVGQSGAGKTSLVNLIPRLYDQYSGSILIDGINTRNISIHSLRKQIGTVPQETFLFAGSIKENISYGNIYASEKEIIRSSKLANAHEFIMNLPNGYDTEVGELGKKLSGGEKQRVAIARAILKNPRILILDEATSQIDYRSEMLIQDALYNLLQDRTTFVIAHRISTIRRADKIIFLHNGKIVEFGSWNELFKSEGTFKKVIDEQFANVLSEM